MCTGKSIYSLHRRFWREHSITWGLTWLLLRLIKSLYHTGCTSLHHSGLAKRLEKAAGISLRSHPGAVKGLIRISVSLPSHKENIVALLSDYYICINIFAGTRGSVKTKPGDPWREATVSHSAGDPVSSTFRKKMRIGTLQLLYLVTYAILLIQSE